MEEEGDQAEATAARESKRVKVEGDASRRVRESGAGAHEGDAVKATTAPAAEAKDAGWEDLDAEDNDDPLMVAEYVNEIFDYMKTIEVSDLIMLRHVPWTTSTEPHCTPVFELQATTMPNGSYMDTQNEIDWTLRGVLVDWLIDTHSKFRMLPETLFLALNVVDRFLTNRTITLNKLQLVGLTAMFLAAKYEEVLCPSVANFLYLADGGYTTEEILKAERYMLKVLGFNLSYANPMNFLRRISKADNYDIQTRTVAKYLWVPRRESEEGHVQPKLTKRVVLLTLQHGDLTRRPPFDGTPSITGGSRFRLDGATRPGARPVDSHIGPLLFLF